MDKVFTMIDIGDFIIGVLVAFIPSFITAYNSYRKKRLEKKRQKELEEKFMHDTVNELSHDYKDIQKNTKANSAKIDILNVKINNICTGGIAVLCDRILTSCHDALVQGETSMIARHNITIMYKLYNKYVSEVHRNPNVKRLYKQYLKLPIYDSEHFNATHHIDTPSEDIIIDNEEVDNLLKEEHLGLTSATYSK